MSREGVTPSGAYDPPVVAAWQAAARDLDIEVLAPFDFSGFRVIAFVREFGSNQGTIVVSLATDRQDEARIREAASVAGWYVSLINPEAYSDYDRTAFRDLLNDWGWFGPSASSPDWYTGNAWTT